MLNRPWEAVRQTTRLEQLLRPLAAAGGPCQEPGCSEAGVQCNYRDSTGARCRSWWCGRHAYQLGRVGFCSRHAHVLELLLTGEGSVFEIKDIPRVDDRCITLADEIVRQVDGDVRELLTARFSGRHGSRVAADFTVRAVLRLHQHVGWERGWSVFDQQGVLTRVTIRSYFQEPESVYVVVNGQGVLGRPPNWLAARPEADAQASREAFRAAVLEAIRGALAMSEQEEEDEERQPAEAAAGR